MGMPLRGQEILKKEKRKILDDQHDTSVLEICRERGQGESRERDTR
tara:strand:+ start:113 stop:250 length:138 start_codon:yes stop_codon:yes gene_type:complete